MALPVDKDAAENYRGCSPPDKKQDKKDGKAEPEKKAQQELKTFEDLLGELAADMGNKKTLMTFSGDLNFAKKISKMMTKMAKKNKKEAEKKQEVDAEDAEEPYESTEDEATEEEAEEEPRLDLKTEGRLLLRRLTRSCAILTATEDGEEASDNAMEGLRRALSYMDCYIDNKCGKERHVPSCLRRLRGDSEGAAHKHSYMDVFTTYQILAAKDEQLSTFNEIVKEYVVLLESLAKSLK